MYIRSFDWDERNENHIAEHGVAIFEVEEVISFCRPFYQKAGKNRYAAYAVTEDGRYLFIVFAFKCKGMRVITARDMTNREKRYYKKRGVS